MSDITPEAKKSIGTAIMAASEKDYVGFKAAIGDEVENRLRTAIASKAQEVREKQFMPKEAD